MQLSNDIYELRSKEPKHGHAFTGTGKNCLVQFFLLIWEIFVENDVREILSVHKSRFGHSIGYRRRLKILNTLKRVNTPTNNC